MMINGRIIKIIVVIFIVIIIIIIIVKNSVKMPHWNCPKVCD